MCLLAHHLGQGLIVTCAGMAGIARQIEPILPAEFKTRPGARAVAQLRARVLSGRIGCVGGDFVGEDSAWVTVTSR